MRKLEQAYLVIDIGNTHFRLAAIDKNNAILHVNKTRTDRIQAQAGHVHSKTPLSDILLSLIIQLSTDLEEKFGISDFHTALKAVGISSVVPSLTPLVEKAISRYPVLTISSSIDLPFTLDYETPATLGADRIAYSAFAVTQFPQHPIIAIDFGTAITYDVISETRVYLGGLILPGISLLSQSLSHYTAQLPIVEFQANTPLIGKSTIQCLQAGQYWGIVGQTQFLIETISSDLIKYQPPSLDVPSPLIQVLLTGGDALYLRHAFSRYHFYPNAVLEGIGILLRHNGF